MEEKQEAKNFGNINEDHASFKKAKACVIQAPYEGAVTYGKGTGRGPGAIIDASMHMELFDDELQSETHRQGIHTSPPLEFDSHTTPEKAASQVKNAVAEVLKANKFPVLLGGEHSLTIGAVKAAKEVAPELSVLYLDAHYDLRDEYKGSKYNHACVARRVHEVCPLVELGTRSLSREEKDFLNTFPSGLNVISVYDILETHDWKKQASRLLSKDVYITIDLDVLDPSLMPSVGTPEPGGIGWYEFLDLLKIVTKEKKIVGFDVVELSPKEGLAAPDFLAAKLIYRLLGYIFSGKK